MPVEINSKEPGQSARFEFWNRGVMASSTDNVVDWHVFVDGEEVFELVVEDIIEKDPADPLNRVPPVERRRGLRVRRHVAKKVKRTEWR